VRQAADVLEQELSSGLEQTRRLQRRFTEQGRLEPGDLSEVVARVRSNAHGLIDTAAARLNEMAADDVQDLLGRFSQDAHDVFDALMDLVDSSPVLINRVLGKAEASPAASPKATPAKATPRKATPAKATPRKATPRKAISAKTTSARTTSAKPTSAKPTSAKPTSAKAAPRKATSAKATPRGARSQG
jgi:hypothetical protein